MEPHEDRGASDFRASDDTPPVRSELIPLDYQQYTTATGTNRYAKYRDSTFFIGLVLGTLVSSVAYFAGDTSNRNFFAIGPIVALVKVIASTICMIPARTRFFGIGLLASIPLGILLFYVGCSLVFKGL